MSRTGAVDELFDEFEEDTPEEVMALAESDAPSEGPEADAFEGFLTVPERTEAASEDGESVPDVDVEDLFGR